MMTKVLIYDGMIYVYILSLLFYFSDFVAKNQRNRRLGTGLLGLVWFMQSVFLVHRMVKLDYMPIISLFDTLFLISWFMVTFSLVMYFFVRFDLLVFYVNILAFSFLVISFFNPSTIAIAETGWDLKDELLYIHIFMAIISYAILIIGAIFSVMYLFLHRK